MNTIFVFKSHVIYFYFLSHMISFFKSYEHHFRFQVTCDLFLFLSDMISFIAVLGELIIFPNTKDFMATEMNCETILW